MRTLNSKNPPRRESHVAIDDAAAAWAAKADRGLTAAEADALEAWTAADPRRAGAYARALAVNASFDRSKALGRPFAAQRPGRPINRRALLAGGGGAIAASLAGAVLVSQQVMGERMVTRLGDIRRVPMADGSAITLNTQSEVRSRYSDRARAIALRSGEALFDVAKDPGRPFIVAVGDVRVQAVGTSFSVRRLEEGAALIVVREGVVETWTEGEGLRTRLTAGMSALVRSGRPTTPKVMSPERLEGALAWRQGQIDLTGLTLSEAAAAFARHSPRRIETPDPEVAALEVAGLYSASDPEGFARAAALSLGLELQISETRLVLTRAAKS